MKIEKIDAEIEFSVKSLCIETKVQCFRFNTHSKNFQLRVYINEEKVSHISSFAKNAQNDLNFLKINNK